MVTKKRKRKMTNLLKPKIKIHVWPKHFCPSFKCKRQLTKSNLVTGKLKFPGFNSWVFWVFFKVDIVSKTWLSKFQDCQNCQKKKNSGFVRLLLLFSRPVVSDSLLPQRLQHARPPCPSPSPEYAQVHVHCIRDAIQPSHPLMPSSPSALNLSQHQGLFQWLFCLQPTHLKITI